MSDEHEKLTREEVALIEAGHTAISRACAAFLCAALLTLICAVPLVQFVGAWRAAGRPPAPKLPGDLAAALRRPGDPGASWYRQALSLNRRVLRAMHDWETALEDSSLIGQAIRPPAQYLLARWLGAGNEQVYCGAGSWLFFRPDVDYLTAPGFLNPAALKRRAAAGHEWRAPPQPDPRPALLDFHRQLAARGIQLVLMPTPTKPMIHPEYMAARLAKERVPLQNPSYAALAAELAAAGIKIFDAGAVLAREFRAAGRPAFLAGDTHWRPEAMRRVAEELAQFIMAEVPLPPVPAVGFTMRAVNIAGQGDIAAMLRLPAGQEYYRPESVELCQIQGPEGAPWRAAPASDVLVLGDSFGNIYSLDAMGWGESAGFVEQLSQALARPLDRILINDNAAFAPRAVLARELVRGRDRLAGKRLVVYQFAARELAGGDWRVIPMRAGTPPPAGFIALPPGGSVAVRGVVADVAAVPRPGSVPYRDHIVSLHLVDVTGAGVPAGGQALVYAWSMRDNVWAAAARLRPGETIAARLRPWSDMAGALDGVNRGELDDMELQLQEPCWADDLAGLGFVISDAAGK